MHFYQWILGAIVIMTFALLKVYQQKRSVMKLRAPPTPSWLLGHQYLLRHVRNVGDIEKAWYRDYGSVFRINGVLNEPVLWVADPKALHYILQISGYRFPKTADLDVFTSSLVGRGLVAVGGSQHQHQRRILNAAFTAAQLRRYLSVFQSSATSLVEHLKDKVFDDPKKVNVCTFTNDVALEILGITSFRYHFNDVKDAKIKAALHDMVPEGQLFPSAFVVFMTGLIRLVPWIIPLLTMIPSQESVRFKVVRDTAEAAAKELYYRQLEQVKKGVVDEDMDIVNVLALSALSDTEKHKLEEDEVLAQMANFIVAGSDTTSASLAWILYEICLHPQDQDKVREEIRQLGVTKGSRAYTMPDYDSMPHLNAVIKETLRLHPHLHTLFREAAQDDVIPLAEPITTRNGETLSEIHISKGQTIHISISMYNLNPKVWGEDAGEWNPRRFLQQDADSKRIQVGLYAQLLSFSAGVRGCIGWKFAILEIQTILVELLGSFEFSLPDNAQPILQGTGIVSLFPVIPGRENEGTQIPLKITPLKEA